MTQQLPHSDQLNIAALSNLFTHTTNSYKYLFFMSLMSLMKDRHFQVEDGIQLSNFEIEMAVTAWYPRVFFKLSFGTRDQIAPALKSIECTKDDKDFLSTAGRDKLRKHLACNSKLSDYKLTRFVPYRILRPFFRHRNQRYARSKGEPESYQARRQTFP